MNGKVKRHTGARLRRYLAVAVPVILASTLLQDAGVPAAAEPVSSLPGVPASEKPVAVHDAKVRPRKLDTAPKTPKRAPKAAWPEAAAATVDIPAAGSRSATTAIPAGTLPITVAPTSRTRTGPTEIRLLAHKDAERAGVDDGLLFTLTPEPGGSGATDADARTENPGAATTVTVDYADFSQAFGGAYSSRLTLAELPACVLTTPAKAECRQASPLPTRNDTEKKTLTTEQATLRSGTTTVLAATAAASSEAGDYKATSLSPSATWSTELNTGDFTWSYDMPVPDVPGGLTPNIALNYSSGAIDGRTGGTNNQSSWIGDGFDLWPGYIERRYKPCSDDGVKNADGSEPADLCWAYDNATISFNGKAGELVPAGDGEWKFKTDDGTKITKLASGARDNGDDTNEYWRVTTTDGTQYYFGYHKLEGWASGKETTDSTWTVPVFGDDENEPCHADAFKDSWCQQAWRWNLDYVVDTHGNAVAYYYDKETNSYGRNLEAKDDTPYTRGGSLDRVEYGLKSTDQYADKPLAKVDLTSAERCLPVTGVTCAADMIDDKSFYWYDTPWDLNCKAGTDCDQGGLSPTFWTRTRLTDVATQVLKADGTYGTVDSWKLGHRWGTADIDYQLLLDSVQHTGQSATPAVTLPKVTFAYTQRANRLDKTGDGKAPFIKERLSTVADESGGQVDVTYSQPTCDWDALPTPETNTTRCFPQYIGGSSSSDPTRQWFNKYVVDEVISTDRTGGAPDQYTRYRYLDDAAWHYDDDDGLTKEKFKTWSSWRGYGHVRVTTGGMAEAMSQEDHYFLRGMNGDRKNAAGGAKAVTVTLEEGEGDPILDHESAAGFPYRTETYSAPGGDVLSKTVSRPWYHETAKRVRSWGTVTANFTGTATTHTYVSLDNGKGEKWRITSSHTEYDTVAGRPTAVDDRADTSTADDNQCTRTTYADNTEKNILAAPARVETVAVACNVTPDRTKDVISDVRTGYDSRAYGVAPVKGDATTVATLKSYEASDGALYLESGATFDDYGRRLTTTDLTANVTFGAQGTAPIRTARTDGRTSTTAYTPATGLPTQITTTTPPAKAGVATTAQTTKTTLDPLRGLPVTELDTNSKRTDYTYDALGRVTKIRLPNRQVSGATPNYEFAYTVTDDAVVVSTTTLGLNTARLTSYTFYDGYLRSRQTQAPGPDGGRLLTDTFYDERGLTAKTFAPYYNEDAPTATLSSPDDALSVESQTWYAYDGLGRETETKDVFGNGDDDITLATTRTVHGGDRTTVIPPVGGTATTTVTDARGRTTELLQHRTRAVGAPADTTRYEYTPAGQMKKLTDPAGNAWTWTYDQLGRIEQTTDPDKGTTKTEYDDRGQLVSTTDAKGQILVNIYDGLGRRTELRSGSATGDKRAEWVYDTLTGAKGQLTSSTRYDNGNAYSSQVVRYDDLYRPLRTTVTIPAAEKELQGTYQFNTGYNANGTLQGLGFPKAGALPGASTVYSYDDILRPTAITGLPGVDSAVTSYSLTGKVLMAKLRNTSTDKFAQITNTYEGGTQRLATTRVDRNLGTGIDKYAAYTYDEAGNVLSVADTSRSGTDNQCFIYDHLRRTTEEWTQPTTPCATTPTASAVGGPAPYWNSYTYDLVGNRRTETAHDLTGDPSQDTKRTYAYPDAGANQPHTLTDVTATGPTGTSQDSYTYDALGNTRTRTLSSGDTQTLDWDIEGHLASVTEPAEDGTEKKTSYLYDAEGNRLIGRTDTETTLYLGGSTEITLAKGSTTPKGTRYVDLGNGTQAIQTDDGTTTFTIADHHGTGQLAIKAADMSLQQRRTTPFGTPRGTAPTAWPGTKGFVGGTTDTTTGLTHLGAREYDPTTGRFISLDPLLEPDRPQTLNGYSYANNNPATYSDPTGKSFPECNGGGWVCKNGTEPVKTDKNYSKIQRKEAGDSLIAQGPSTNDRTRLHKYYNIYQDYTYNGYEYWETPVGDDDRMANACFGRLGCKKAISYLDHGGDVWGAKVIAATYCLDHPKQCGINEGEIRNIAETWGSIPFLLLGMPGGRGVAGAGKSGAKAQRCSFDPDTPVLLEDGTTKPIGEIEPGDKVQAADPNTGEHRGPREVTATLVHHDDDLVDLEVRNANGVTSTLRTTANHPFWDETTQDWTQAAKLSLGHTLTTPSDERVMVSAVKVRPGAADMYNLTVTQLHTYYVLAGSTPVLVHNSGPCGISTRNERAGDVGKYTDSQKTRDPASQWYHEELSNEELLDGINKAGAGDGILVSQEGKILGGHHRKDELLARIRDGRIDPDTPIRIDVFDGE